MRHVLLALALLILTACAQQNPPSAQNVSNASNASAAFCGGPEARNCTTGYVCQYSGIYPNAQGTCVPENESPGPIIATDLSNASNAPNLTNADDRDIYACRADEDCVRQSSCCDCGEGTWVNRKYYDESPCPPGTPQCKCPTQLRYPVCENGRCTSRSAR